MLRKLNIIIAIYRIGDRSARGVPLGQEDYTKLLMKLGVSVKELEDYVRMLHSKGATSALLEKPPFIIVLDKDLFVKELAKALRELEEKLLAM